MKAKDAMLCWNSETKTVGVLMHPVHPVDWRNSGFCSDVGASSPRFKKLPPKEQALALITEGVFLIRFRKFNPESVFLALDKIDECREALTSDPFSL
jgi:hypothetical protein